MSNTEKCMDNRLISGTIIHKSLRKEREKVAFPFFCQVASRTYSEDEDVDALYTIPTDDVDMASLKTRNVLQNSRINTKCKS